MQTDEVVHFARVLDHPHVLALAAAVAQGSDRRGGVAQQPFPEGRIAPGAGHHPRAVLRSDPVLIGVDQLVESGRIDQPLLDQQQLERLDAQRHVRGRLGVVMGVMLVGSAHDGSSRGPEALRAAGTPEPKHASPMAR